MGYDDAETRTDLNMTQVGWPQCVASTPSVMRVCLSVHAVYTGVLLIHDPECLLNMFLLFKYLIICKLLTCT